MYESSTDENIKPNPVGEDEKSHKLDIEPPIYENVNRKEKTDGKSGLFYSLY